MVLAAGAGSQGPGVRGGLGCKLRHLEHTRVADSPFCTYLVDELDREINSCRNPKKNLASMDSQGWQRCSSCLSCDSQAVCAEYRV